MFEIHLTLLSHECFLSYELDITSPVHLIMGQFPTMAPACSQLWLQGNSVSSRGFPGPVKFENEVSGHGLPGREDQIICDLEVLGYV